MKHKLYQFWKPLLAITFWGASFVATKFVLNELKPVTLIVLRLILAIILLSVVANRLGRDFKISI
ncbi:MAG: EamA family transporter, partial [Ignavibacteria bacterium]|nr:EamA family transporter [Ignavibacteria bacterium]